MLVDANLKQVAVKNVRAKEKVLSVARLRKHGALLRCAVPAELEAGVRVALKMHGDVAAVEVSADGARCAGVTMHDLLQGSYERRQEVVLGPLVLDVLGCIRLINEHLYS